MEIDFVSCQPELGHLENGHDETPKPQHFSTALASTTKPTQLEVVLHSHPRKDASTPVDQPSEDYVDADLVTSDLVSQPTDRRPEPLAVKTSETSYEKQPPTVVTTPVTTITPQPKKRGRPFGWRLGAGPYSAMTGETPRPPKPKPASEQKPRGRPGRKPAPTTRQIYLKLNPHFLTFRCEWEDCPAELQNLDTLRKHLLKFHGRAPSSSPASEQTQTCKWANCTPQTLPTKEAFSSHIETAHLTPLLWHVGDGPRNTSTTITTKSPPNNPLPNPDVSPTKTTSKSTNPSLPSYLFSPNGKTLITPSIRDQQVENEDDRKKRQARVNRVLAQRDRNAPEEPMYDARELEEMARFMSEKQARQRMLREYADRYLGWGGGEGGSEVR